MIKIQRSCLIFLIILLLCSFFIPVVAVQQTSGPANSCFSLDAGQSLVGNEQLNVTAQAALLYSLDYDTMVYSFNPDQHVDPSGMNKILTALLAIEKGDLDSVVTVSYNALSSVEIGAVSAGLKSGEKLTLRDLLYCMMVGSANDAAAVIAEHIGGSQGAFISMMNKRAQELGCTNSFFLNPTGLSQEGQFTSARDLAKITAQALKLEVFRELFSAKEYTIAETEKSSERKMLTTNYMLSDASVRDHLDTRVIGGKTGALSSKDRSLITLAEKNGVRYLTVVMSAIGTATGDGTTVVKFGNFEDTKTLLNHGYSQYTVRQLLSSDMIVDQLEVIGGENDLAVITRETVSVLIPNSVGKDELTYRCTAIPGGVHAPVSAGDVVGNIQIWYGSTCVAECELTAMYSVREEGTSSAALMPQADPADRVIKRIALISLLVLIGIVFLVIGILLVLRIINTAKARRRKATNASIKRRH